jgi:hypothetical protein
LNDRYRACGLAGGSLIPRRRTLAANALSSGIRAVYQSRATVNSLAQHNSLERVVSLNLRFNNIVRPGRDTLLVLTRSAGRAWRWKQRTGERLKVTSPARPR